MPAGSNSIPTRFTDSDGPCFRSPAAAAFQFVRNPRGGGCGSSGVGVFTGVSDGGEGRQLKVHGTLSHEPLWQGSNATLPGD